MPLQNYILDINELARRITPNQLPSPPQTSSRSSMFSHLPPEVLAQIFCHSIPCDQFPIPTQNEAPLLLTRVSSSWRTLAINTPDLWSAFHINYKDSGEDIPAMNLWLARSTNRPLNVSLAIDFGEQSQQGIVDALCRHSKRWKYVRFDFRHLYCPPMYSLDIAEGSIPELTTFEFHARDISSTNLSQIIRLLRTAPKIREITWVDDLADTDILLDLPLKQLTRLSLAMEHGTLDYIQILNCCSSLEHLSMTRPLLSSYQTKPSPLFMHKLTSLNISYDLTAVLDCLVFPSLKHVRIFTANDGNEVGHHSSHSPISHNQVWDPSPLISLIDRSACEITTLSLSAPMVQNALLLCLSKTSASLISLEVEGVEVGDRVLSYLTHRRHCGFGNRGEPCGEYDGDNDLVGSTADEDLFCPQLEDLILHTQIISSQGVLADMIASRLSHDDSETTGYPKRTRLRKLVMIDGHWDLDSVKELSSPSKFPASRGNGFKVYIIPRKKSSSKGRTRNYFFRRKLCASR